jgi:inosose dehydratase
VQLACHTITWGGVYGSPVGITSAKDAVYVVPGDLEQALREIAALGFAGVELFDGNALDWPGGPAALRALLDELELALVGVYTGGSLIYQDTLPEELWRIERAVALAAALEAPHVVVGGGAQRYDRAADDGDYDRLARALDRIARTAEHQGVTAHYHPHLTTMAETPEQIEQVFSRTSIGFCPDLAHLAAAGGDPAALVRRWADRISYVHLKDARLDPLAFVPLGEGDLDLDGVFDALDEIRFDGWATVELDEYAGLPREAARIGLDRVLRRWPDRVRG